MSGHTEITEKSYKEDSFQINSSDDSTKLFYEDEENEKDDERKKHNICNALKRYSRFDLLSLRNGQLSIHYPHCALRPELQVLSIWTCRLRCELHYLGLWKISNTGISYGNCNGSCSSYTCSENGSQSYASTSYVNSQQLQQQSQLAASSSPTSGSKRSVRSRERSLNYQRCINADLIRGTSPAGSGDQLTQHNLSHSKTLMDHRSMSSSHLMPAFAKRRMGHTNPVHNYVEVCSNSMDGHHSDNFSNDCNQNTSNFDTALRSRKELIKNSNNQNDLHIYKTSSNSRADKNSQYPDDQTGWMTNLVKKVNTEFSTSNCKSSNTLLSGGNKKLVHERRIGSGRLVPRDVNWEIRGSKKLNEKDNNSASQNSTNNNIEKDKSITSTAVDELNNRSSFSKRFVDGQEGRFFDRRVISIDDSGNSIGSSSKRFSAAALGEEGNNFESSYHQQNFTGQRSMSFRRREFVDHRDHYRDFRDFRGAKESRECRDHRVSKVDENHHNKDEPEWFSEGPTSQHDTIELRGFEDSDESHQHISIRRYGKMEMKSSESSLSNNSICNNNLSTKENVNVSGETANNSCNNTATNYLDRENDNNNININETNEDILKLSSDIAETKTGTENSYSIPEELSDEKIRPFNETELFFDNFLSIEALENSLIGSVNDQTISNNDICVGRKSRFSRWFFSNSNNQKDIKEYKNNPPTKDDHHRLNKDLNESEFNSFMTFLKCNNIPTPELPKSLPSNVSALSVEELEASMRKMDAGEEKAETAENDFIQTKISENERTTFPQSVGVNTQDVEAFRKLLDQLLKPRVDISMNIILPNTSQHSLPLTNSVSVISPGMTPLPPSSTISLSAMSKQEYVVKVMHQQYIQQQQPKQPSRLHHQQNIEKMVVPHVHHQRMTPKSSYQQTSDNLSIVPASPLHHHQTSMILSQSQKRLDVQHLIQSVVRGDLSRSFLENELKNPNIPPYTKDIISTVLKETSKLNAPSGTQTNLSTSETTVPDNENITAPNNLIQSLARGEVSLNHLELELNKLCNIGSINEVPSSTGILKEKSRCSTPLPTISMTTNSDAITPLPPSQVVSKQQQSSIQTKENVAPLLSDQQQAISSIIRSHHNDDSLMHPTQRELQMHTQAIMQNAIFKKKIEVEQHEQRRRQEMHKQHELESSNSHHQQQSNFGMTLQVHQQPPHVNSPTPLAFTPTSVLRKMTAEKDTTSQTTSISSIYPQQTQQHLQQPNSKLKQHQQHQNQPRMILGGGGFQYMHQQQHHILPTANGSPQISPQQKSQIRNQPAVHSKWSLITHSSMESNHSLLNNMSNKPIGRPILKGPGPIVSQSTNNPQCQNQLSLYQNSQSMQQINQMQKYPSIHYQQQQPPRQIIGQQFSSSHMLQHQIPSSQQNNMHNQQLLQQQRSVVMQRQIQQNDFGNLESLPPSTSHSVNNDNNSAINLNYQRDGGLSPTSNQLAQWFSPELLAQASAGKLPLLNMNQALSLEEFERNIQHSSNAVHN